jgi:hypothetical protein
MALFSNSIGMGEAAYHIRLRLLMSYFPDSSKGSKGSRCVGTMWISVAFSS